jgi:hypothetical protein
MRPGIARSGSDRSGSTPWVAKSNVVRLIPSASASGRRGEPLLEFGIGREPKNSGVNRTKGTLRLTTLGFHSRQTSNACAQSNVPYRTFRNGSIAKLVSVGRHPGHVYALTPRPWLSTQSFAWQGTQTHCDSNGKPQRLRACLTKYILHAKGGKLWPISETMASRKPRDY